MSNSPRKSIHKINEIRASLKAGHISFDEAKALAYPLIKEMEHSAEKIAKDFNRPAPKFNFTALMR